jgi:hypothetical protein
MAYEVRNWQDLAEKSFLRELSEEEINELGLTFKPGKDFSDLIQAINSTAPRSPYNYEAMVATVENILRDHLQGDLRDGGEL